jgi:hypothetical protein
MQLNWGRGFFRAWAVFASLWILFFGWQAYTTHSWWRLYDEGCREHVMQAAKWPDGKPFDEWERAGFLPYEVKNDPNRWQIWQEVWQKVDDCEAAKPLLERVTHTLAESWYNLTSFLPGIQLILLPPIVVLMGGLLLRWTIRGFAKSV